MKIRQINDHIREVEIKTQDKDQRLGIVLDSTEPKHIQIYNKMWNQNAEIWERRMNGIELEIDMLEDIIKAKTQLIEMYHEDCFSGS